MFNIFKKRKSEEEQFFSQLSKTIDIFINKIWKESNVEQKFALKMGLVLFSSHLISKNMGEEKVNHFISISLFDNNVGRKIGQKNVLRLIEDRGPYYDKILKLSPKEASTLYSGVFVCPLVLSTSDKFYYEFDVFEIQNGISELREGIDAFITYLQEEVFA